MRQQPVSMGVLAALLFVVVVVVARIRDAVRKPERLRNR